MRVARRSARRVCVHEMRRRRSDAAARATSHPAAIDERARGGAVQERVWTVTTSPISVGPQFLVSVHGSRTLRSVTLDGSIRRLRAHIGGIPYRGLTDIVGLTDPRGASFAGHSGRGVNRPPEMAPFWWATLLVVGKSVDVRGTARCRFHSQQCGLPGRLPPRRLMLL